MIPPGSPSLTLPDADSRLCTWGRLAPIQGLAPLPPIRDVPPPLVPVILSGGAGTRLWPLSREMAPKAFMRLPDGETLLGEDRRARAFAAGRHRARHRHRSRALFPHQGSLRGTWRPQGRACRVVHPRAVRPQYRARGRAGGDGGRGAARRRRRHAGAAGRSPDRRPGCVRRSRRARGRTCARGRARDVRDRADARRTGFGYLECGDALDDSATASAAFRARRFVEKPDARDGALIRCAPEISSGTPGMFCFTRRRRSSPRSPATRRTLLARGAALCRRVATADAVDAGDRPRPVCVSCPICRSTTR